MDEAIIAKIARAICAEKCAQVVAFIRADATLNERLAKRCRDGSGAGELNARSFEHLDRIFSMLADAIERGDHRPAPNDTTGSRE